MDVFADLGDGTRQLLASGLSSAETNELIEWWSHVKPVGMTTHIVACASDYQDLHVTVSGLNEVQKSATAKKIVATAADRWHSL